MKQFVRYSLLALLITLSSLWIHSAKYTLYVYRINILGDTLWLQSMSGCLYFGKEYSPVITEQDYPNWIYGMQNGQYRAAKDSLINRFGILLPDYRSTPKQYVRLPFWIVFTPLLLLTLKLWYAPLQAWWRGTGSKGFEVEVSDQKKNERQDAEIAKEMLEKR